jgi:hypothetical protein
MNYPFLMKPEFRHRGQKSGSMDHILCQSVSPQIISLKSISMDEGVFENSTEENPIQAKDEEGGENYVT